MFQLFHDGIVTIVKVPGIVWMQLDVCVYVETTVSCWSFGVARLGAQVFFLLFRSILQTAYHDLLLAISENSITERPTTIRKVRIQVATKFECSSIHKSLSNRFPSHGLSAH